MVNEIADNYNHRNDKLPLLKLDYAKAYASISLEGLHVKIEDIVQAYLFKRAKVRRDGTSISHIFYADDVIMLENGY